MAEETQTTLRGTGENRLMKALCYFTYLWLIPYFVVKGEQRNESMLLHLKQGFGGLVICMLGNILQHIGFLSIIGGILLIICFVLNLIGFINAVTGKDNKLPIVGEFFDSTFNFVK